MLGVIGFVESVAVTKLTSLSEKLVKSSKSSYVSCKRCSDTPGLTNPKSKVTCYQTTTRCSGRCERRRSGPMLCCTCGEGKKLAQVCSRRPR